MFHVTNSGYSSSFLENDVVELEDEKDLEDALELSLVKVCELEFDDATGEEV